MVTSGSSRGEALAAPAAGGECRTVLMLRRRTCRVAAAVAAPGSCGARRQAPQVPLLRSAGCRRRHASRRHETAQHHACTLIRGC